MLIRLSKFLSRCGVASRRKSEDIILNGRIKVNNNIILEPYYNVDCNEDIIMLDNNIIIKNNNKKIYIMLNKPKGYISDLKDVKGRKIARDLINIEERIFPVGRLDYNSEGLIIFTNDGQFANRIIHPKYCVEKEYLVKFKGMLTSNEIDCIKKGIVVEGVLAHAIDMKYVKTAFNNQWYSITLHEGRNRIIRKIGDIMNHRILKIKRIRIGHIELGNLDKGLYRLLKEKEIMLFKIHQN